MTENGFWHPEQVATELVDILDMSVGTIGDDGEITSVLAEGPNIHIQTREGQRFVMTVEDE